MPDAQDEDFVEIYRTPDLATAEYVRDEILTPEGIPAAIHNRQSTMIPAPAALEGAYFIAVAKSRAAQAMDVINDARESGALPDTGEPIASA